MAPLFSVILPSYNRAAMVRTALKTVQWQTFKNWECLVINDGSTDGTRAVLAEFAADPRIRPIFNTANEGMNASRNKAIREAQGDFVTFLDSDDLWLPHRLEGFRARADRPPSAGFLFSNAYVWRFDRVVGTLFSRKRNIPEGVVPGHFAVGDRHLPYVTTNVAIQRRHFAEHGLFRTDMKTLDTELFARFLAAGVPVAALREPLSVRRLHAGQLTTRALENFEEALVALKAGDAPAELITRRREEIAREVAGYLIKGGAPAEARIFIRKELGEAAVGSPLYLAACVPAPLLNVARLSREFWLRLHHHPALASAQVRQVSALIRPLLDAEAA